MMILKVSILQFLEKHIKNVTRFINTVTRTKSAEHQNNSEERYRMINLREDINKYRRT